MLTPFFRTTRLGAPGSVLVGTLSTHLVSEEIHLKEYYYFIILICNVERHIGIAMHFHIYTTRECE